ncbi:MAG: nickel pincer cofactor biosynthesis protein LarC [Lachnospiraceae bacterium]|nr:nickel pincer cofactor biosynthesis protein LarC [Lachnospiraceae bacterium]
MRILYLDCGMGAAGDMLTTALLELLPDSRSFLEELNGLGIPGIKVEEEAVSKCGILGTHITVKIYGEEETEGEPGEHLSHEKHFNQEAHHHHEESHHHSSMHHVEEIIGNLPLSSKIKKDILAVYGLIAEAESHVHGVPVSQIHFHEVGSMDAVADVTAVCMLMDRLAPERIVVSPVHVGSGQVKCAHGILPVPAPATAYLLRDIPIYGGGVKGELCTPTGAALLKYFADSFGDMPVMKIRSLGYGMGKKDFERANCVRALLGETENGGDSVAELSCNIDDMTGEAIGFAMEELFAAGALEVYTVPVGMKKSRPGILLCVMCREEDRDKMLRLIFRHTTTIGVRESVSRRYKLDRSMEIVRTPYGDIRRKVSSGYGITRKKYEYDDLSRIARERGISIGEIREEIE